MAVSLRMTGSEGKKESQPDIYQVMLRMLMGLAVNLVGRFIKSRMDTKKQRKKAQHQIAKLSKKGKEIPEDLKKEAERGLSRREKKKIARKAKKKKKKRRRILVLIVGAVILVLVVKARTK